MNMIADIKERNEKVYILADASLHSIIGPLKHDIEYLLKFIELNIPVTPESA
jgi:hypothetical protein